LVQAPLCTYYQALTKLAAELHVPLFLTHNLLVPGSNPGGPTKISSVSEVLRASQNAPIFPTFANRSRTCVVSGCGVLELDGLRGMFGFNSLPKPC
jgi:hypothetical protein